MVFMLWDRNHGSSLVLALLSFSACVVAAAEAPADALSLDCVACQVLSLMLYEDTREMALVGAAPGRFDLSSAVSEALNEGKVCRGKRRAAWAELAQKYFFAASKLSAACTRLFNELEEQLENSLITPGALQKSVSEQVCQRKRHGGPICPRLWTDAEAPVSRTSKALEVAENRRKGELNQREGEKFMRDNAKRAGVMTLRSGLQYKVLRSGSGTIRPGLNDRVGVHYRATLIDCVVQPGPEPCIGGTEFDSTLARGRPAHFTAKVAGSFWIQALPEMVQGEYREFYVPHKIAYGANDQPERRPKEVGPNATLIFSAELVSIEVEEGISRQGAHVRGEDL